MSVELRILIPEKIVNLLKTCELKTGIRMEDLIMMAVVKLLEEYGVKPT
jgi:hypothetical protein